MKGIGLKLIIVTALLAVFFSITFSVKAQTLPSSPPPFYPPAPSGPPSYAPIPPQQAPPAQQPPVTGKSENGVVNPRTGEYYPGAIGGVINPQTGVVLPKVGGGYLNPQTGEVIPKKE